jgi:hypothetical protein
MTSSRKGRLVLIAVAVTLVSFVAWIHNFLALNCPVRSGVLVVEGWLPRKALDEVPRAVASAHYSYMVFVQYPNSLALDQERLSDERSFRQVLENASIPIAEVQVPSESNHRTYAAALVVKEWLTTQKLDVRAVDVFTVGVHARKSQFLYRQALGDEVRIGVIAGAPLYYNPTLWFISPRGVWLVTRNLAGYAYSVAWIYTRQFLHK